MRHQRTSGGEKPFGRDFASAVKLNRMLHRCFPEDAIFRIGHYPGKEPVQNILDTRFSNPMFEPIWNRTYVRSIQITMAESIGVRDRGRFYDGTGAVRDVVQNHLLQVLAVLTMDPPTGEQSEAVRDEKARLLKAVRPIAARDVVYGQYAGYRSVPGVSSDSATETFVAARLYIDTWRWADVPIYVRAARRCRSPPPKCGSSSAGRRARPSQTTCARFPATCACASVRTSRSASACA